MLSGPCASGYLANPMYYLESPISIYLLPIFPENRHFEPCPAYGYKLSFGNIRFHRLWAVYLSKYILGLIRSYLKPGTCPPSPSSPPPADLLRRFQQRSFPLPSTVPLPALTPPPIRSLDCLDFFDIGSTTIPGPVCPLPAGFVSLLTPYSKKLTTCRPDLTALITSPCHRIYRRAQRPKTLSGVQDLLANIVRASGTTSQPNRIPRHILRTLG